MKIVSTRRDFIGGAATLAAGVFSSPAFSQAPTSIDIGTMAAGSSWYQYGALFSQYIQQALPAGTVVNVRPYAAADGNLKLIERNSRIQVGLTFSVNVAWALAGMKEIESTRATHVRAIAGRIDQYYVGMMALAKSGLTSISDALAAKRPLRIVTLQSGSLGDISTRLVLQANGVDEAMLRSWGGSINRVSLQAAADGLTDGRADIWINPVAAGHPKVQEVSYSNDISWLTLSDPAMQKLRALGYVPTEMPAGSFNGQKAPVLLPGTGTMVIVNSAMPDEIAYKMTKALLVNRDALVKANAALSRFDPKTAWTKEATGGAPLHPGAERAYRELGFMT